MTFDSHRDGIQALKDIHATSRPDLAQQRDIGMGDAKKLKDLAERWLGRCDSPAVQRSVLAACHKRGYSLDRLKMIDTQTKGITGRGARWKVLRELCDMNAPFDAVRKRAIQLRKELVPEKPPQRGLRASQPRGGNRTLTWHGDQHAIAALLLGVDNEVAADKQLMEMVQSKARGEALHRLILDGNGSANQSDQTAQPQTETTRSNPDSNEEPEQSPQPIQPSAGCFGSGQHEAQTHASSTGSVAPPVDGLGDCGVRRSSERQASEARTRDELPGDGLLAGMVNPKLQTSVIITLQDYVRVLANEGNDVQLARTDGTTMSGAQYVTEVVRGHVDPCVRFILQAEEGPVNTYRARFANTKQRALAEAEHPVCAWPGCHVPSYLCEMHHIKAYSKGGESEPRNLVPLCRFHNRVNGDDPDKPRAWGRMERVNGQVEWHSPYGDVRRNEHPATQRGAAKLIRENGDASGGGAVQQS